MSENKTHYGCQRIIGQPHKARRFGRWMAGLGLLLVAGMFLPWTQNIYATGKLTTLIPDNRPQNVNSTISGRIEKWYIREGEFVEKGDTLVYLSEVKDAYFDPALLSRIGEQIEAKSQGAQAYAEKAEAQQRQIAALQQNRNISLSKARNKWQQARLKRISDSAALVAEKNNYSIAKDQYTRIEKLYEQGLKSLTEVEARRLKLREAEAKLVSAENKLETSASEVVNARLELGSLEAEYADKIAKAESERFTALSSRFETEAGLAKMRNEQSNYRIRSGMYYVRAPQSGYVVKTMRAGIGEMVKEGEALVTINPSAQTPAVELYVRPADLPLVNLGQHVRLQFDGWPALVFSGWPGASAGTFAGTVKAIDKNISDNGKYRILVAPDSNDVHGKWPAALLQGGGATGWALLKNVPVWKELWRQLNAFPPDMYTPKEEAKDAKDKEKK